MRIKQKIISLLLAVTIVSPVSVEHALAAAGVIYITPGSSSIQAGNSETVSLRINPGTSVDGVQATVSYNPSSLRLNSVDNSASPFSVPLQKSAGGGTITLSLGNLSGGVAMGDGVAVVALLEPVEAVSPGLLPEEGVVGPGAGVGAGAGTGVKPIPALAVAGLV